MGNKNLAHRPAPDIPLILDGTIKTLKQRRRTIGDSAQTNDPRWLASHEANVYRRKLWTSQGERERPTTQNLARAAAAGNMGRHAEAWGAGALGGDWVKQRKKSKEGGAATMLKRHEDDAAFRAFLKEHAGRAMVTGPRLEEYRKKFEKHKVELTKIGAAQRYTNIMNQVSMEWELRKQEAPALDDEEIEHLLAASGQSKPEPRAVKSQGRGRYEVHDGNFDAVGAMMGRKGGTFKGMKGTKGQGEMSCDAKPLMHFWQFDDSNRAVSRALSASPGEPARRGDFDNVTIPIVLCCVC